MSQVLALWLIAAGVQPTQAKALAEPLDAAMALHDIGTREQRAAFLAQACHESAAFTRMEENLYYTTPTAAINAFGRRVEPHLNRLLRNPQALANFVYADRMGNGSEASGDGWRYRGRGIFQLTGTDNYRAASDGLTRPYLAQPELVAQPSDACLTAAWFWSVRSSCNDLMLKGDFDGTTLRINGKAMHGADARKRMFGKFLKAATA